MHTFHHPAPLGLRFCDASEGFRVCAIHPTDGQAEAVKLEQHKTRKSEGFRVTYGQEVHDRLTQAQAARYYGEAVMHGLALTYKKQGRAMLPLVDTERD